MTCCGFEGTRERLERRWGLRDKRVGGHLVENVKIYMCFGVLSLCLFSRTASFEEKAEGANDVRRSSDHSLLAESSRIRSYTLSSIRG